MPDDPLETTTRRLGSEYGNLGGDPLDGELEAQFEALAQKRRERRRRRLTRAERSLEQSLQQEESLKNAAAVDPSFWQEHFGEDSVGGKVLSGLGTLIENSPVAGIPETVQGLHSYASELAGKATGEKYANFENDPTFWGSVLNLHPLGLLANVVGIGTHDSELRKRGREQKEKVGRSLGALEEVGLETPVVREGIQLAQGGIPAVLTDGKYKPGLIGATEGVGSLFDKSESDVRDWRWETAYETGSDPTMFVDLPLSAVLKGAYQAAKASKLGQAAIKRFPKLALLPERAWLKFNNRYKEAMVLGDEKAQELYALDRAFSEEAAPELLKIQQDIVEGEAKLFSRVEAPWRKEAGLAGREETLGLLSNVVEAPKEWRKVEAARLSDDDVVRETLLEAAEFYDDIAAKTAAVERKFGIQTADLQGEFEYFMRQLSPELREFMRTNPSARKILTGEAGRLGRLEFEQAWAGYEKGRKLGNYNYRDSEDILRKTLREEAGLPDDIPIWDRDAFGLLRNRLERDTERMKVRHLYAAATDVYGQRAVPDDQLAGIVAKMADAEGDAAQAAAKAAEAAGIKPPAGHMSALQLLKDKKVALPDDIQSLSKLATTWISPADAKFVAKYADNFYWRGLETRGAFGRFLDGFKGILQRALLARPGSLSKDWIGTASQGFMAGNLAYLEGARKSLGGSWGKWAEGIGKGFHADDDVLKLMAEGVLNTTRHDALEKGLLEGVPVLGRIEERGLIGAALPGKAGKAVAKVTDSMLDARVWFEQVNRLATYRKAIQEGLSHREAVEQVYAYWGKFDELSKFDRNVLNRLFLFWSWRKASVPIALRNLLDKPLRSRLLMMMMAGNTEDDERVPEWARRLGGWTAGTDENGNMRVISVGDSSYFGPLASLVRSDSMKALKQGEYQAFVSGAAREVLRSTPAYWQSVGELTQEQDYFTNQSWWGGEGRTGQTTKAPMAFWWLMNHDPEGKPTALQELLGLKDIRGERDPETGEPGPLRHITMKPAAAWLLGALPGAEPLLTDVSAFVDPRSADVGEASLLKGGARVAGVPVYSVAPPDEQQTLIRDVREALHKDADRLAGGALDVYAGRLTPSNTGRGQSLRRDMEQWQAEAKAQGLGEYAARAYVDLRLQRLYQQEWRLMELDRRLAYLQRERTKGVKDQRQFQLGDAA